MAQITTEILEDNFDITKNAELEPAISEAKEGKKYRQFMYVQRLDYMNVTFDELGGQLDIIAPMEWAMIVHDKDTTSDDFDLIEPHVHLVLKFKNPHSLNSIANILHSESQYIAIWKGSVNNAYSYLLHRTPNAATRYQYAVSEVTANFDFEKRIEKIENGINHRQGSNDDLMLNRTLDAILDGDISDLTEAYDVLPGRVIGKHLSKIKAAFQAKMELDADAWRENKKQTGEQINVIWLYGAAGTGKTRFAKSYLEKFNDEEVFVTGSSKDPFQSYRGEHKIILDDIRPNEGFTHAEMLRMLDPWNTDMLAASRYFDKTLQADVFVITSPLSPAEFYGALQTFDSQDGFDQLLRRLTATMYFDDEYVYPALADQRRSGKYYFDIEQNNKIDNIWTPKKSENHTHTQNLINQSRIQTREHFTRIMNNITGGLQ